jgi:hypothetical protein
LSKPATLTSANVRQKGEARPSADAVARGELPPGTALTETRAPITVQVPPEPKKPYQFAPLEPGLKLNDSLFSFFNSFSMFWRSWMDPLGLFRVPQNFSQPILPGWMVGGVINVDENNSSSPQTEREVVATYSYGTQLNRLMDAVCALIESLPPATRETPAFSKLLELSEDIGRVKSEGAAKRLEWVASDLARLKATNPAEYESVVAKLRTVLSHS